MTEASPLLPPFSKGRPLRSRTRAHSHAVSQLSSRSHSRSQTDKMAKQLQGIK